MARKVSLAALAPKVDPYLAKRLLWLFDECQRRLFAPVEFGSSEPRPSWSGTR